MFNGNRSSNPDYRKGKGNDPRKHFKNHQQESDQLFPEQNYYRPMPDEQARYSQQRYGQYGYGQDFSPGITGNLSNSGGSYPQYNNSQGSSIGGSYQKDNSYQSSSSWSPQSSYDKDSAYTWEEPQRGLGREDRSYDSSNINYYGKGPKGFKRSDARIYEDVCEALFHDSLVDASEIEVAVKNGEVTLSGAVENRQMKRLAEDCAEKISGVIDVKNEIRILSNDRRANFSGKNEKDNSKLNSASNDSSWAPSSESKLT